METIKLPRVNIFMPFIVRDFSKMAVIGGGILLEMGGQPGMRRGGGGLIMGGWKVFKVSLHTPLFL